MNTSDFGKPNGKITAGVDGHAAFIPNRLPPVFHYDDELINLLAKAETKIGELRGIGELLADPNTLIMQYLRMEAVLSSKIEGTLASIQDVLQYEAMGKISKEESERIRLREVINYVKTLQESLRRIKDGEGITLGMIKQAHKILLKGVRGHDKNLGEFREVQNWIVRYGESIENSTYTPPPPEYLYDLLQDLESFLQTPPKNMPVLIQCAISHYQFEAIHPFEDGNGRIGRVLIALLLAEKDVLSQPLLYLSAYFEGNLEDYYRGLLATSQNSSWTEWLKFFLRGIARQSEETIKNIHMLMDLQKRYKDTLMKQRASGSAILLLDRIFENPYITIPNARDYLKMTYPSAKGAVMILVRAGILEEVGNHFGSRLFLAKEIVKGLG